MVAEIDSLAELARRNIAKYVFTNEINREDLAKLNQNDRNRIFHHGLIVAKNPDILIGQPQLTSFQSLRATKLELDDSYPHERVGPLVKCQKFGEMTLRGRGILSGMNNYVNKDNRHLLTILNMYRDGFEFADGWTSKIRRLPLKALSLHGMPLRSPDFLNVLSLPSLKKLHLTGTRLTTLIGISKLENLEELVIRPVKFARQEQIEDIFALKKLKILDIGSPPTNKTSQNVKLFVKCEKSLPELAYLGCDGNQMYMADLEYLVDSHPKLAKISLIDTPLESIAEIERPSRQIKLLTNKNMESCLEAYQFHIQVGNESLALNFVFTKIWDLLKKNLSEVNDLQKRKCFDLMVDLMIKYKEQDAHNYTNSLTIFCMGMASLKQLLLDSSFASRIVVDKELIIKTVLKGLQKIKVRDTQQHIRDFHEIAWELLSNEAIVDAPKLNDMLSEKAADTIRQCALHGCVLRKKVIQSCSTVLTRLFEKMNPHHVTKLVEDRGLIELFCQVCTTDTTLDEDLTLHIASFVARAASIVPRHPICSTTPIRLWRLLWSHMIVRLIARMQFLPPRHNELCMKFMEITVSFLDELILEIAVSEPLRSNFWSVFYRHADVPPPAVKYDSNHSAVSFLVQWVECIKKRRAKSPYQYKKVNEEIVLKVKNALTLYNPDASAKDLDVIFWVAENSTCDVAKDWANEVLLVMGAEKPKPNLKRPAETSETAGPSKKRTQ